MRNHAMLSCLGPAVLGWTKRGRTWAPRRRASCAVSRRYPCLNLLGPVCAARPGPCKAFWLTEGPVGISAVDRIAATLRGDFNAPVIGMMGPDQIRTYIHRYL